MNLVSDLESIDLQWLREFIFSRCRLDESWVIRDTLLRVQCEDEYSLLKLVRCKKKP